MVNASDSGQHVSSRETYQVEKFMKLFSAVISLKTMIFLICKKDTEQIHEYVIKTVNVIALLRKNWQ